MDHSPLNTLRRPEVIVNPYPFYAQLRREAPIMQEASGAWIVSRYRDALEILTNPDASSQRLKRTRRFRADGDHPAIQEFYESLSLQILFLDPPHHTRLRALASKAFTPAMVQRMRGAIQQTVNSLLDAAAQSGRLDVIRELAVPLPMRVICDMLDIPEADRPSLKRWSADYAEFLGNAPLLPHEAMLRIAESAAEYMEYFRGLSARRRAKPGDDLLSALLLAENDEEALTRDAVCATAVLLITAGHETTTNLIGNGLLGLLRQPDAIGLLQRNPELWPGAVEELLRFDSPVQLIARRAGVDMQLDQHTIAADDVVFLFTGGANRDPERFVDPDRIDVTRTKNRHLSFGQGPHYCIGAALARLEAQVALSTLLARFGGLRLLDSTPEWLPNPALRGLARLPITLDVARAA
jgi:cytochrome P450